MNCGVNRCAPMFAAREGRSWLLVFFRFFCCFSRRMLGTEAATIPLWWQPSRLFLSHRHLSTSRYRFRFNCLTDDLTRCCARNVPWIAIQFSVGLDRIREFCKKWHVGCTYEVGLETARGKMEKTFVFSQKKMLMSNRRRHRSKKKATLEINRRLASDSQATLACDNQFSTARQATTRRATFRGRTPGERLHLLAAC
jgi:hypothetical protein